MTDLTRIIGADAVRAVMNHDPNSRTLEKYYLDLESTRNLVGVTLNEKGTYGPGGHSDDMVDKITHLLSKNSTSKLFSASKAQRTMYSFAK